MQYETILFDLDGTLNESAPGIIHSAQYGARQVGFTEIPDEMYATFIGPPLHSSYRRAGMNDEQAARAVEHYRVYFAERGMYENSVYVGIPNLLRRLKAQGARLCVATAKPQYFAEKILERLGLARFFDIIAGAEMTERGTDKSDLVQRALVGSRGRAVMIGDREFDVFGGQGNGIDTIGVLYGYGTREEFRKAGATHIVETVADLADFLAPEIPEPEGFFITVEGLDGSGKTSQIERIHAHLVELGYDVLATREPGGSPIAESIREVVLTPDNLGMHPLTEALLYAAARAEHVHAIVRPALKAGKVVLCDRFVDSSVAYQGGGRQLGVQHVLDINAPAIDGTMPDATVLLKIDAETALKRRSSASSLDRIEMEQMAFHQRVYDAYEELARMQPERIIQVDATRGIEEIAADACAGIDRVLAKR